MFKSGESVYMRDVGEDKFEVFAEACHKVADYGLVRCSSGNLSWRVDEGAALLSTSRSWLCQIRPDEVAVCDIETGMCVNDRTPTCESVFHLGILRNRPEQSVVLHFQSPYATAIACAERIDYDFNVIIEVPFYIGEAAIIPYLPAGSVELAEAIIEAMKDRDMAILRNHGLVTVGRNFDDAIQKATFFELACQVLLCGDQCRTLSAEQVEMLRKSGRA